MLWIALAAAISAPVSPNLHRWFSGEDVPKYMLDRGLGLWIVGVRVSVGLDGKVEDCAIETTSRIPDLDILTCKIIFRRAKFSPARWIDGSAAVGVYRTSIKWVIAKSPWDSSEVAYPDLDLSVQSLPRGVSSPALVRTMFAVNAAGQMSSCTGEPGPALEHTSDDPALMPVACDQLLKSYKPIPAKDSSGKPMRSVQDALVRFSVDRTAEANSKGKP